MSDEIRILTVEEISNAKDIITEVVPTSEWGEGTGVVVKSLTLQQLDELQRDGAEHEGDELYAKLRQIRAGMVEPILSHKDHAMLAQKNMAPIVRIIAKINELSGLGPDAEGDAEKNSSTTERGGSSIA